MHEEIDKEVLGGLGYRDFCGCSCMYVCTCVLRVYMYVTVHECLYAEVNTWLIIIILLLWCIHPQGVLELSSICSDNIIMYHKIELNAKRV